MGNHYFTPEKDFKTEICIKNSRFLANLLPADSSQIGLEKIKHLRSQYKSASHHCWAVRIGAGDACVFRYDDDGEPAGTAGRPILQALETRDVSNALLVVTRYFGGTKLGIGGLIRAYSAASFAVLDCAALTKVQPKTLLALEFEYAFTKSVQKCISLFDAQITKENYSDRVELHLTVLPEELKELKSSLTELTRGKITIHG